MLAAAILLPMLLTTSWFPGASTQYTAETFLAMDTDGDGCVSLDEQMADFLNREFIRPLTEDEVTQMREVLVKPGHVFLDKDNNGCITLDEIQPHLEKGEEIILN